MPNPPLRIPWRFLDSPERVGASEFGFGYGQVPKGYEDALPSEGGRYQGQAASQSLPYSLPEGNPNGE